MHAASQRAERALQLFEKMLVQGLPQHVITYTAVINACSKPEGRKGLAAL